MEHSPCRLELPPPIFTPPSPQLNIRPYATFSMPTQPHSSNHDQFRDLRPRPRPWPFAHDGWPSNRHERQMLDRRFAAWLRDYVNTSIIFYQHELERAGIEQPQIGDLSESLRKHILSSWARELVELDGILNLIVYGKKRDKAIIQRLMRRLQDTK